jgi:hypothetical protein
MSLWLPNFIPFIWSFPIKSLFLWQNHQAMKLIKGEFKEPDGVISSN